MTETQTFTLEQEARILAIFEIALEKQREKRMIAQMEREKKESVETVTKLYLVTLSGHQLALPDENGRAILTHCCYAYISTASKDRFFYSGPIEVVAHADGRLMKTPFTVIMTGNNIVAMVEVDPSILKPM